MDVIQTEVVNRRPQQWRSGQAHAVYDSLQQWHSLRYTFSPTFTIKGWRWSENSRGVKRWHDLPSESVIKFFRLFAQRDKGSLLIPNINIGPQ